ncbi:hypothetical protein [Lysinibacillus sp. 54212]|uniref:hypothetical protein n=1 Tax=Lysinibacillus sp. 54212 TaxID=3119829 RepID=UPI002FC902CF
MPATNIQGSTVDWNTDYSGGVRNTITWTDSLSNGALVYKVMRNTTNSVVGATTVAQNISAGTQLYVDTTVSGSTQYYYFIEASNGIQTVVSQSYSIVSAFDSATKASLTLQYKNSNFENIVFNPVTNSFENI